MYMSARKEGACGAEMRVVLYIQLNNFNGGSVGWNAWTPPDPPPIGT